MQRHSYMRPKGHIDRTKHEVDITERVLEGGVWAGLGHLDNARVVVDVAIREWPLGTVASTGQVERRGSDDDEDTRRKR
jgi:hypothetical protein